ncbi:GntR family transcriptional regulator [Trueperella pecoris]|uniref:GntR family transcriptional regulator n=1 Tax=Trueperella pecoris TaxID=2733571 RepID=A0A7M1QU58_9ACTO|nr:GntR family transcriptional regulator [Trueperella pecoris]QOR45396.1 GntR family transcriptional regulator [Trueperella pecoris]
MEPKYAKVYDALLERIADMSPGERLESEVKLASSFNVSPMTVRRALMLLSQNGLTVGIPGRGTFVADREEAASTHRASPSTTSEGRTTTAEPLTHVKLISAALQTADEGERQLLHTTEEPFIARIQRNHYLDEEHSKLVGIEVAIIRADLFPGILGHDLSRSLPEMLESDQWQLRKPIETSRTIRATMATASETKQLHLAAPVPLLALETSFVDGEGLTLAEITCKYLGDQIEITL